MQDLIRRAVIRSLQTHSSASYWIVLLIIVVAIVGILNAVAIREYQAPLQRARLSEVFLWTGLLRYDLILHHAQHGIWPDAEDVIGKDTTLGDYGPYNISSVRMNRGSFNLVIDMQDAQAHTPTASEWNLSFLRQTDSDDGLATVLWSCGWAQPQLQESQVNLPNLTNIPPAFLPAICRYRRE